MKSMLFRSMRALGLLGNESDENLVETSVDEIAGKRDDDKEKMAADYLQALTSEHIPTTLLDKMTELINSFIPGFLQESINKEVEKKLIYDYLSESFTEYIRFISGRIQEQCSEKYQADESRFKDHVVALNNRIREIEEKSNETQRLHLSAERQKRALTERSHELEMKVVALESFKEQLEEEKKFLQEKIKTVGGQEKNMEIRIEQLISEKGVAESRITELETAASGVTTQIKDLTDQLKQAEEQKLQWQSMFKEKEESENKETEKLTEEYQALQIQLQELTQTAAEQQKKADALVVLLEKNQAEKTQLENSIEELVMATVAQEGQLASAAKAREQLVQIEAQLNEVQSISGEWKEKIEELEKRVLEKESLLSQEKNEKETVLSEIEELRKSMLEQSDLTTDIEKYQEGQKNLQDKLSEKEETLSSLKREIDRLEEELNNQELLHKKELEQARSQIASFGNIRETESVLEQSLNDLQQKVNLYEKKWTDAETEKTALWKEKEDVLQKLQGAGKREELLNIRLMEIEKSVSENSQTTSDSAEMDQLSHDLLVANDMLAAVKAQRQELLANMEVEHREKKNLQQYISGLEESLKQWDHKETSYKRDIEELQHTVQGLREISYPSDFDESSGDDDVIDWLVPTRPDTPEMVEKRKAEKRKKEQELEAQKSDSKPDPSQMSLW